MKAQITLNGTTPLITHNNQLVNPLHPLKKEMSAITSKRKKTDADHLELYRLEFIASLYHDEKKGPYMPQRCLRKLLISGARKDKNGKQFESGLLIRDEPEIQYEGPRGVQAMWESQDYHWTTPVKVGTSSVMRTRAKFDDWKIQFGIEFEEELLDIDLVKQAARKAAFIGLCDARSIGYGRFQFKID